MQKTSLNESIKGWGPIKRWSYFRNMQLHDSLWGKNDVERNAQGRLPDNESVQLPAIWVVELYTPSTVQGLLKGISDLNWEFGKTWDESLTTWMIDVREGRQAGTKSLGIVAPIDNHAFMHERTAPLPEGVKAALPVVMSVTPSLTAIIIAFLLTDELAGALNIPLHANYSTYTTRNLLFRRRDIIPYILWKGNIHLGYSIHDPDIIRREEVKSQLKEIEPRCTTWVSKRIPGVFASSLQEKKFPTEVLLITELALPLSEEARRVKGFYGLSIDRDFDAWESNEWSGGRLVLPIWHDNDKLRLLFTCRRHDAFPEREGYPDQKSNWGIAQQADEYIQGILSRWALTCLLDSYHQLLSNHRDKVAGRLSFHTIRDLKELRLLANTKLYDIVISAQEIEEFVNNDQNSVVSG